jgi:O-antigen/teichoic acid export membrane protein
MFRKLSQGHWPIFLFSSMSSIGNLFLPIFLVRLLTPEEIGIYKIFFIHLAVIPFLMMAGAPVHSVFYWTGHAPEKRREYLNATWTLAILLSTTIVIIGLPLSTVIANHLGINKEFIYILIFCALIYMPSVHYSETTIALGRYARGSIFETVFELCKVIGFVFIAWKFRRIDYVFYFFVTQIVVKLLFNFYLNAKENQIVFSLKKEPLVEVMRYSFPIALSACLSIFVDKFDMLLLSAQLDSASFAFYSMGCLAIPPLYLLETSVQKVLIPKLSEGFQKQRWRESAAHYRKAISDIGFLIIPAIFGLIIFARPIVVMLFTETYLDSVIYLQIFSVSYILLLLPHDSVARATGQTKWIMKMYFFMTPLALLGTYLAAKIWGAVGVLSISIAIKLIPKFLGIVFSKKMMNWNYQELIPLKHLVLFIGTASVLSIGSWLLKAYFSSELVWFIGCGGAFGIIYLALLHFILKRDYYAKH